MSDTSNMHHEMATNDFVNDLKSLPLSQTEYSYSIAIEDLLNQLKQATPNGLAGNMPFFMALVDNFYRIIPIFEQKLSSNNDNSRQTNLFLETFASKFGGPCLLNLFLTIKDSNYVEFIFQKYIPLLKQSHFTNDKKYDSFLNCLLPIIAYSSALIPVTGHNLPPNLLSDLLEFVKKNWQCKSRGTLINNIFSLMKVFSKSPSVAPVVLRSGWPDACIQWLATPGCRPSFKTDFFISLIIQKLARHAIGVKVLNNLNCIQALCDCNDQMKTDYNEEEYTTISFLHGLTYALLVEADEIKRSLLAADGCVYDILGQLNEYILNASQTPSFVYRGCHISELLSVLSKLFVNDELLKACFKKNSQLFDCLCELLIQFTAINAETARVQKIYNDEALLTLANLLWSISFQESYHQKFKSNAKLMQTLSNLATSSSLYANTQLKLIPTDIASLKKSAESILWNLKSSHPTASKEKPEGQPLIMISYSHSDSKFCHELVDHLSQHIPVWVDYKQAQHNLVHSDDLWEEIAGAMETATVIVLVVSKEYYDSKSCRQELSYASDTLKKRIVPIYAPNQQYKANGWLGIRIAGQKYIHFGRKAFADALTELLAMIAVDQKSTITTTTIPKYSHQPISFEPNKQENLLNTWTTKEIRKWFDDNHIHEDLISLYADQFHTGTSLLVYAHHLKQFYRNEYIQILANYQNKFPGKRFQTVDYITFVDAFWRLRREYDPQSKMEDALERYGGNQLPSVMKILSEGLTWL